MQKLSKKTIHFIWAIFVLSILSSSFSFAQVVIKDSIDIGPRQLIHTQSTFSGNLTFEIPWPGKYANAVHLEVLDPNGNFLGFDPYTESSNGDYSEIIVGPDGGVSRLTIPSPSGGFYQISVIVDTSVDPADYGYFYAMIYAGGDTSAVEFRGDEFGAYFGEVYGTRFHEDVAYWTLYVPCVSNSLTLVVPQIGYVYQPSLYDEVVDLYVQDGCGEYQDPGSGYYIRAELLDGLQWGDLYDPNSGRFGSVIDSIPIISGQGIFEYRPWGNIVVQPEQVDLKISSNFPGFTPSTQSFQVLPGNPPLEVLADRDTISYGDTTTIKCIMENSDGTPSTGQLVGSRFTILQGDSAAFLYSPDSTVVGRDIFNVDSVRLYVPPATASSTTSVIKLIVEALEPCSDCYASIAVRNGSAMLPSGTVKAKATKAGGTSSLSQREALYRTNMLALWKKAASSRKAPVSLSKNGKPAPKVVVASSKKSKVTTKGISDYDGLTTSHYGMGIVTVMAPTGCLAVVLSANQMNAGDTITVSIEKRLEDGVTLVPYPAGTLFTLNLQSGQAYGTLVGSGGSGTSVLTTSPALFVAKDSIDVYPGTVTIYAVVGVGGNSAKRNSAATTTGPTCDSPPEASAKIHKKIDNISLALCLDEILNTGQMTLSVSTLSKNKAADPPDGTTMNVNIGPEGTDFASIKNTRSLEEGPFLNNISYDDIAKGNIIIKGRGVTIPGKFPLGVRIVVSTTIDGNHYEETEGVFLENSTTPGVIYTQGDSQWDTSAYDFYKELDDDGNLVEPEYQHTIGEMGCALSGMAMGLTAFGNDYNPYTLNKYMNDHNDWSTNLLGNHDGSVDFDALHMIDPNFNRSKELKLRAGENRINLADIDPYLDGNSLVLAQVNGGRHWIVITGKNNGVYSVIDPGGSSYSYCKKVTLDAYTNSNGQIEVFRTKVFTRK